jgi:hypothetical protein
MNNQVKATLTPIPKEYGQEDRQYKLKGKAAPLEYVLPTRNTHRFALLYYDDKERVNKSLRYARNQRTPFEEEQDTHAIIEPVIFENGFLSVPRTNPLLQWFLDLHPLNGTTFLQVNKKLEAEAELELMDIQDQADESAKKLTNEKRREIGRVLFGTKAKQWTEKELLVQTRKYAQRSPKDFLKLIADPEIKEKSFVHQLFDEKLVVVKFEDQICLNLKTSKEKILEIPKKSSKTKEQLVADFLTTSDGEIYLEQLQKELDDKLSSKA